MDLFVLPVSKIPKISSKHMIKKIEAFTADEIKQHDIEEVVVSEVVTSEVVTDEVSLDIKEDEDVSKNRDDDKNEEEHNEEDKYDVDDKHDEPNEEEDADKNEEDEDLLVDMNEKKTSESKTEIETLINENTLKELRDLCRANSLGTNGRKQDLARRIVSSRDDNVVMCDE